MGKKGSNRRGPNPNAAAGSQPSMKLSLREESTGKKQNVNPKSILKLDHLKNLAVWASSGEPSIPPLAAFFGQRLAASSEALGVPPDPSLFSCQRCESILRPGYNCTVRIEKNKSKRRRRKKSNISFQNNVVYKCHFCSHKNLIRGTPRGYIKEICPPKAKPQPKAPSIPDPPKATAQKPAKQEKVTTNDTDVIVLPDTVRDDIETNSPATPSLRPCTTLLDSKRKKRTRSSSKKAAESEDTSVATDTEKAVSASSKRRRKGWTSLKEIAESSEKGNSRNLANLTVPFFI